ncbi:MAG: 50S ribosomal protein L17 [Candidatus Omnitrophica bacterium]|nr:50S ribosomal protein L17 [Candidatus Omnitrophota bacterium]MCA9416582.1 50S ribosomal protein L17 [Candidatus Omnitrophota bacterium]MCA9432317.1 50S ribosomal protein L17 [Candidatus Omnitrophota bacterium]MCA9435098.1 50S ribosomal protein L17 [Candidatus Omnitrophota bacterium]MCA9440626.1 50S ribosomal protein L17 [Candidatus Omnitrophota bacterium]
MYHRMGQRKLNRSGAHINAMLRNQAASLIRYGFVTTTLPKAKELRRFVEPIITTAKEDNLARRRKVNRDIPDRAVVQYLFEEIGPRYISRPGGYTRIIRLPNREGDNAPVARLELIRD